MNMAEVDSYNLQLPEDVRLKLAELDLELSEGKLVNFDFFRTPRKSCFCCQNVNESDSCYA
jgi:hypothetical protein